MSDALQGVIDARTSVPAAGASRIRAWIWRLSVYGVATLFAIVWSFFAGKDLNWDALNYHLYAGYSAVNDRFGVDFLAAGPQAYFNPYAHVPLYAMVMANWSSLAIGTLLAAVHSINLWLTYELALLVAPRTGTRPAQGVAVVAMILAALNPVLLQTTGSTYVDTTTGAIALGGWVVLAAMFHRPAVQGFVFAGVLLGIATALKLSNAVFAIAGIAVLLCFPGTLATRMRNVAFYGLGGVLAFSVVYGPWGWKLWQDLRNPFFPFFNGMFRSPEFMTEPLLQTRFVPETLAAALWRPVEMTYALPMVHVEPKSPDARYIEWVIVMIVVVMLSLRRRFGHTGAAGGPEKMGSLDGERAARRAFAAITVGFIAAWCLWLYLSGNSRYFMPMGCVVGVLVAAGAGRLLHTRRTAFALLAVALVAPQAWMIVANTWTRWAKMGWGDQWYDVAIPERFSKEPFLYLGVDPNAGSFLMPFLAPGSAMMSISGQQAITPEAPGGRRAVELLAKHAGHVRIMDWVGQIRSDGTPLPYAADHYDGRLRPFGLKLDRFDCGYVLLRGGPRPRVVQIPGGATLSQWPPTYMLTCGVIPSNENLEAYYSEARGIDRVFERIEQACPKLFSPTGMPSQQFRDYWQRVYVNSEVIVWIYNGRVLYQATLAGADSIDLGSVDEWSAGQPNVNCSKRVYRHLDQTRPAPR